MSENTTKKAVTVDQADGFIRMSLEATGIYVADETPDRLVRNTEDGECVRVAGDGSRKLRMALVGSQSSDVAILNPMCASETNSVTTRTYYNLLNTSISLMISTVLGSLINWGYHSRSESEDGKPAKLAKAKTSKAKGASSSEDNKDAVAEAKKVRHVAAMLGKDLDALNSDTRAIELASALLHDKLDIIDDKFLVEFDRIIRNRDLKYLIVVSYDKARGVGRLTSALFNDSFCKANPNIRESTVTCLRELLTDILCHGSDKTALEDFDYTPTCAGIPEFDATMNLFAVLFRRIKMFSMLLKRPVNKLAISAFCDSVKYIPQYYEAVRWSVTTPAQQTETKVATPAQVNTGEALPQLVLEGGGANQMMQPAPALGCNPAMGGGYNAGFGFGNNLAPMAPNLVGSGVPTFRPTFANNGNVATSQQQFGQPFGNVTLGFGV